jgi:hypothetical protein
MKAENSNRDGSTVAVRSDVNLSRMSNASGICSIRRGFRFDGASI